VPALVRISVMLDGTRRSDRRAPGLALKLFPGQGGPSANALFMETMGGVVRDHLLDAVLDNEPALGQLPAFGDIPTLLRIRHDLKRADREASEAGPALTYRPLTQLAEAGSDAARSLNMPRWVRLRVTPETPRVDADDFRDELDLSRYPQGRLVYLADAGEAGPEADKAQARWRPLARLTLTDSVVSASCDQRLHFAHPVLN
jgi:hypothetical protein